MRRKTKIALLSSVLTCALVLGSSSATAASVTVNGNPQTPTAYGTAVLTGMTAQNTSGIAVTSTGVKVLSADALDVVLPPTSPLVVFPFFSPLHLSKGAGRYCDG